MICDHPKTMVKRGLFLLLIPLLYFVSCSKDVRSPEQINFAEVPYDNLSEYGFFEGSLSKMNPSDRVLPYEPISQLFSDYAEKSRFVWMPEGVTAEVVDTGFFQFDFPDKAILIKNFYYSQSEGDQQRIIETRLLIKQDGKWNPYAYIWNDEQTEAAYKIAGATIPVSFTTSIGHAHSIDYVQPNKNQCKSCHNQNEVLMPLGPKARNLNFEYVYENGEKKNQLDKWAEMGYLKLDKAKEYGCMVSDKDETASLELRAKAYLDINCAHCHSAEGPANTSGLFLTYEETNDRKWGIYKTPIAAGKGAGSFRYDIHPGQADSSIFVHRMKSNEPGVMMPEIGRRIVHEEGVALISEWINSVKESESIGSR